MEFALGMLTGIILTYAVAKRLYVEIKKDIETLKEFDRWKEWKN